MLETIWNENWIWLSGQLMSLCRITLVLAGVVFCAGILRRWLEENDIVKLLVLGTFLFLAEYIIVSALLFAMDGWGITRTLFIVIVSDGGLFAGMFLRKGKGRKDPRLGFYPGKYLPVVGICLAALLLAHNRNGYFGMQQDQGVYQTSAIAMIYGDGKNEKELTAYKELSEEDRRRYMQVVPTAINGFYFYDEELEGLYPEEFSSESAGHFHGIPTYPALLALWGGIFGLGRMGGIQVLLYLLLLSMGYIFLYDLGCGRGTATLCCGILAASPMVLWVAQSTLTEIYLACALLAFLYFLTREERAAIWLSAISVISFGCIHFSLYTLMPVVVLIYAGLYIRYRKKDYCAAGMAVTAAFWFSTNLTRVISTKYFYLNVVPLLDLFPWLENENVMEFITVVCVAVIVAGAGGLILLPGASKTHFRKTGQRAGKGGMWGALVIRIVAVVWCVMAIAMSVEIAGSAEDGLVSSCAAGFCVLGGVVMLPAGLMSILAKPRLLWKDRASALTGMLFAYCVMFYSLALRDKVGYYYYYGRYLVPFIPLIIWQGAQALLLLRGKARMAAGILMALAQIVILPYDMILAAQKDDTRMEWEALEAVCGLVAPGDVLIIEDELLNACFLPLTYMLQADVIPQMQYPPEKILEIYSGRGGNTYFLSSGQAQVRETFTVMRAVYSASEDSLSGDRGLLGLPVRMEAEKRVLQLDRQLQTKEIYMPEEDGWIGMYKDSGFRWGCGSEYGLSVCLDSADYIVHIRQGSGIPGGRQGLDYYPVQVYVNGFYLQELQVGLGERISEIVFELPALYVREGENILLFKSDPWHPRDYGATDYRELGISVGTLWFETK